MNLPFETVDDFLRKVKEAKSQQLDNDANEWAEDYINDPGVVGVPDELCSTIEHLFEKYGDEAFRQIGMFCLGKWHEVHVNAMEDMLNLEDVRGGIAAATDSTKIATALMTVATVGSFGGDEEWRQMIKQTIIKNLKEFNEKDSQ